MSSTFRSLSAIAAAAAILTPTTTAQAAVKPTVTVSTSSPALEHPGDVVAFTLTGHGWPAGARLALAQRFGRTWFVITRSVAANRTVTATQSVNAGEQEYRAVIFRSGRVIASSTTVIFTVR